MKITVPCSSQPADPSAVMIAVTSYKGGVGKTTTAVHLAAYLQRQSPTLLVDGDPNRSASRWQARGQGLPFPVVDETQAPNLIPNYQHILIDTQARPTQDELKDLIKGCDLIVLPCTPDALSLDALLLTLDALKTLQASRFQILLTIIPPWPSRDGAEARSFLQEAGLPVLNHWIRRMVAYQKAALAGVLVSDVADRNAKPAWSDYVAVGKEILA